MEILAVGSTNRHVTEAKYILDEWVEYNDVNLKLTLTAPATLRMSVHSKQNDILTVVKDIWYTEYPQGETIIPIGKVMGKLGVKFDFKEYLTFVNPNVGYTSSYDNNKSFATVSVVYSNTSAFGESTLKGTLLEVANKQPTNGTKAEASDIPAVNIEFKNGLWYGNFGIHANKATIPTTNIGAGSTATIAGVHSVYQPGVGWVAQIKSLPIPSGNLWAACGDSITNGSSAANFRYSWFPKLVASFNGLFMRQDSLECGVGGTESLYAAQVTVPAAIAAGARKIIVMVGMNDSDSVPVSDYMANIISIYNQVAGVGGTLFLITPTPRGNANAAWQDRLRAFRKALLASQGLYGYFLIDGFSALLDTGTGYLAAAYDSGDGVHPNDAGHMALFQAVAKEIKRVQAQIWSKSAQMVVSGDVDNFVSNGTFPNATGWYTQASSGTASVQTTVADSTGFLAVGQWLQNDIDGTSQTSSLTRGHALNLSVAAGDVLYMTAKMQVIDTSGDWQAKVVTGTAGFGINLVSSGGVSQYGRLARDAGVKNPGTGYFEIEIGCFISGVAAQSAMLLWLTMNVPVGSRYTFRIGEIGVFKASLLGFAPADLRGNDVTNFI